MQMLEYVYYEQIIKYLFEINIRLMLNAFWYYDHYGINNLQILKFSIYSFRVEFILRYAFIRANVFVFSFLVY